eukprot:3319131-Alexandrium_andersonii.AAC.1
MLDADEGAAEPAPAEALGGVRASPPSRAGATGDAGTVGGGAAPPSDAWDAGAGSTVGCAAGSVGAGAAPLAADPMR